MCVVFVLVYVYDWQGRTAVADCQANNQSINQSINQWKVEEVGYYVFHINPYY